MDKFAFDQFARLENAHWWFRGRRAVYMTLLRSALGETKPRRVLDLGAGVGGFPKDLGEIGDRLFFTEYDRSAAQLCSTRFAAQGVRAQAQQLPFAAGSMGLISLFDVLEHITDDERALSEIQRVLEPGGLMVLSVPAHAWLYSRNDEVAGHVRRYSRTALMKRVREGGFRIRRCTYANTLLFPAIATIVLAEKALSSIWPSAIDEKHTNLSLRLPAWADRLLFRVFKSELLLSRKLDLPLGHSLFLVAEKVRSPTS